VGGRGSNAKPACAAVKIASRAAQRIASPSSRSGLDEPPTIAGMERHDCKPPMERRPIEDQTWTCPECGDVWRVHPLTTLDPAPSYDFSTHEHIAPAEWVRVGSVDAAQTPQPSSTRTIAATSGWSRGAADLRCSFCGKPRSAVGKLIAGPGTGPSRVLICDECVDLCVEIIAEEQAEIEAEQEEAGGSPPTGPTASTE